MFIDSLLARTAAKALRIAIKTVPLPGSWFAWRERES
jgi:hypothetical protein